MRSFIAYLLTFMILWVSTWMITDIHDLASTGPDQPHPLFSVSSDIHPANSFDQSDDTVPDCHVCSYDHGGHMGQVLPVAVQGITLKMDDASSVPSPLSGWHSHTTTPDLKPPIA